MTKKRVIRDAMAMRIILRRFCLDCYSRRCEERRNWEAESRRSPDFWSMLDSSS